MDFEKIVNPVVKDIPPSGIRKFFDLANQMEGVISLGVGEPDFVHIADAAGGVFINNRAIQMQAFPVENGS